jgi:hypothetical protein
VASKLPIPPARPTPLLLSGLIDKIDVAGRFLHIGSHAVEMLTSASLDGLKTGDRAVVRGMRDPMSGRILGHTVMSVRPQSTGRLPREQSVAARIRSFVVGVLAELCRDTRVLDTQLLPKADWYAIRVAAVDTPGKAVLLPRRMLERALDDPAARRTVRDLLQVAITVLHARRAGGAARPQPPAADVHDRRSWSGARCVRCEGPLSSDDPIVDEAGAHGHLACPPSW